MPGWHWVHTKSRLDIEPVSKIVKVEESEPGVLMIVDGDFTSDIASFIGRIYADCEITWAGPIALPEPTEGE